MQRLWFLATVAVAVAQLAGCGGSSMRTPIEPGAGAAAARVGVLPGGTPVLGGAPGPLVLAVPRALPPQRISASIPPALAAYDGIWSGQSIRQACIEAGGAVDVACRVLPRGNPVRIEIAQDGAEVRAELSLGGQRATMVGRVGADGTLVLRGAGGSSSHTITIEEWRTTIDEARIRGTLSYVIAAGDEGLGSVTVVSALDGLTLERIRP